VFCPKFRKSAEDTSENLILYSQNIDRKLELVNQILAMTAFIQVSEDSSQNLEITYTDCVVQVWFDKDSQIYFAQQGSINDSANLKVILSIFLDYNHDLAHRDRLSNYLKEFFSSLRPTWNTVFSPETSKTLNIQQKCLVDILDILSGYQFTLFYRFYSILSTFDDEKLVKKVNAVHQMFDISKFEYLGRSIKRIKVFGTPVVIYSNENIPEEKLAILRGAEEFFIESEKLSTEILYENRNNLYKKQSSDGSKLEKTFNKLRDKSIERVLSQKYISRKNYEYMFAANVGERKFATKFQSTESSIAAVEAICEEKLTKNVGNVA